MKSDGRKVPVAMVSSKNRTISAEVRLMLKASSLGRVTSCVKMDTFNAPV